MKAIRSALTILALTTLSAAGEMMVSTGQIVRPAGDSAVFPGRPVDLVLSADNRTVFVKNRNGLVVLDAGSLEIRQNLINKDGASLCGVAVSRDGRTVYYTPAGSTLAIARADANGKFAWERPIGLPPKSYPCGVALSPDEKHAYVALSRNNSLAVVNVTDGKQAEIPVGVAPYGVTLSPDGTTAYVSNWGGRRPKADDRTGKSAGTDVLVDERGIPSSGTISKIDLAGRKILAEIPVGLHPSSLVLRRDGTRLYVANANSDTVSVIDTGECRVVETILVRPDEKLPFGSITCGLALSPDERTLLAANGGNNAIAIIALNEKGEKGQVKGFVPAGWFPAAVTTDGKQMFIANAKGDGPELANPEKKGLNSKWYRGTISRVTIPDAQTLAKYTRQVMDDGMIPQILRAREKAQSGLTPKPVPAAVGAPSVFEHVVFVLKENRTYDQVFGDMKKGNGDANLCMYGREITPNHHAIAEQFVLLDNYYCNGVLSADGHQWATQGIVTDYQEKTFGGWTRSYDFGTDPLAFAPTDFIWDNALLHGLSFRNYGEFDMPSVVPSSATWHDMYAGKASFKQNVVHEPLKKYTAPNYPGWNLRIPDAYRLERFLQEFREYEKKGNWPNLVFVYLPQDHTSGSSPKYPTPRAYVADNDLALGKLVEAISKSPFWAKTCIFVNEDDPQDGVDHVDGHRSLCLVISPYTKRGEVVSHFYNQTSVLHTIERILGLPPMNQFDALAPTMEQCFTDKPDLTPYTALPNRIPLDEMITVKKAGLDIEFDLTRPDRIDDDAFNRVLWLAAKGPDVPYPAEYAGSHGKGLKALGLQLDKKGKAKDDDD